MKYNDSENNSRKELQLKFIESSNKQKSHLLWQSERLPYIPFWFLCLILMIIATTLIRTTSIVIIEDTDMYIMCTEFFIPNKHKIYKIQVFVLSNILQRLIFSTMLI